MDLNCHVNRYNMSEKLIKHYTDSVYYDLELTAKYCRTFGVQLLGKYYTDFSFDELTLLDTIDCNPGVCQRDLAKLILRDRANTGRALDNLEKKGLIRRFNDTKNKRLVRKVELTEKGKKELTNASQTLEPAFDEFTGILKDKELESLKKLLYELRKNIKDTIDLQI